MMRPARSHSPKTQYSSSFSALTDSPDTRVRSRRTATGSATRATTALLITFMLWCGLILQETASGAAADQVSGQVSAQAASPEAGQFIAQQPFSVLDISAVAHPEGLAAKVVFSEPLDPKRYNSADLRIEAVATKAQPAQSQPAQSQPIPPEGEWVSTDAPEELYFFGLQPETTYRISVLPSLTALSGNKLVKGAVQDITSPAMPASVGFAGSGSLLPLPVKKGLPVMAVNVPEVDIDFFRIKADKLSAFFESWRDSANLYIYNIEQLQPTMELVHSGRFRLDIKPNVRGVSHIPIQNISQLSKRGVYLAVMRAKGQYRNQYPATYFTVSDLGVHLRSYKGRLDFWVNDLQSGEPLPGAELYVLDRNGMRVTNRQLSDMQGHGSFAKPIKNSFLLVAEHGESTSIVPLFTPALDLSGLSAIKPLEQLREQRVNELFLYGPRDLYRPGETAVFSGLLRDGDGRLQQSFPLKAELYNPLGKLVHSFSWHNVPDSPGYYEYSYPIDADAATGPYSLKVTLLGKNVVYYDFHVEEFLPERLRLELGRPDKATTDGKVSRLLVADPSEKLIVPVSGAYLYGAPASGNTLTTTMSVQTLEHPFTDDATLADFSFGPAGYREFDSFTELDDQQLDESGALTLRLNNSYSKAAAPLSLNLWAALQESGGRPVSRNLKLQLFPRKALLGIRPLFSDGSCERNSTAKFELVRVDMHGTPQQGATDKPQAVKLRLIREERQYNWFYSESSGWQSSFTSHEYPVYNSETMLPAEGPAELQVPVGSGYYRLEVSDLSNETSATGSDAAASAVSYSFYAGWRDDAQSEGRPDQIDISLDKPAYQPGDTISVTIADPFSSATATADRTVSHGYLLVEGDGPLWFSPISMAQAQGRTATFTIPMQEDWRRHDLYVSAVLIQPGGDNKPIRRAVGTHHLRLDRQNRQLGVSIEAPAKILPGRKLITRVKLSNIAPGSRETTRVTLAAVDVGVLNISHFATPNPFTYFFAQRRYPVELFDLYQRIIQPQEGGMADLLFGGGAELEGGGQPPPSDVQIVSLFSGVVTINSDGLAEISLDSPDFDGELRLMAVAFNDDQFGSADKAVTVASPVVAQLSMPRFLAAGDRSTLALDLTNLSGFNQELSVELGLSDGLQLIGLRENMAALAPGQQHFNLTGRLARFNLSLAAHSRQTSYFSIEASEQFGATTISVDVDKVRATEDGEVVPLHKERTLGIRPAYPAEVVRVRGRVTPGHNVALSGNAVRNLIPATVNGYVTLASFPPINLAAHFSALRAYPYGCLEQTTSGVFPQLQVTDKLLAELHLEGSTSAERQEAISKAIRRLATMQNNRGGFGLWSGFSPEEPWLTAYVTDFLLRARNAGYTVNQQMLGNALQRLQRYLKSSDIPNVHSAPESFAVRTYSGLVLSRLGQAPLGTLRTLDERLKRDLQGGGNDLNKNSGTATHPDKGINGLAWVQLGLAMENMGASRQGSSFIQQGIRELTQDGNYYHSYGSRLRDLALALHLLAESNAPSDRYRSEMHQLGLRLDSALQAEEYFSTQERNALFLAGAALLRSGAAWQAELLRGDTVKTLHDNEAAHLAYSYAELVNGIEVASNDPAGLFAAIEVGGYPRIAPPPSSNVLNINRQYYRLDGSPLAPEETLSGLKLTTGELLICRLHISAPVPLHNLLAVNLLPAGLELENQNLADSVRGDRLIIDGKSILEYQEYGAPSHEEFRDDRYLAAFDLDYNHNFDLFFLVRAVTPGSYRVPPPLVEAMYQPDLRAVGTTEWQLTVRSAHPSGTKVDATGEQTDEQTDERPDDKTGLEAEEGRTR